MTEDIRASIVEFRGKLAVDYESTTADNPAFFFESDIHKFGYFVMEGNCDFTDFFSASSLEDFGGIINDNNCQTFL